MKINRTYRIIKKYPEKKTHKRTKFRKTKTSNAFDLLVEKHLKEMQHG